MLVIISHRAERLQCVPSIPSLAHRVSLRLRRVSRDDWEGVPKAV